MKNLKEQVYDFWNKASCGEELYLTNSDLNAYEEQLRIRYKLEPYIEDFADFKSVRGLKVLEIGVGLGADHQRFAENGAELFGIDLTERSIEHTKKRLKILGLSSTLYVGDAESLDFPDDFFDIVYSWGVLHHTPDTAKAVSEVYRVLKPKGKALIMLYHKWSLVGFMLWTRYALLKLQPWLSLTYVYSNYLESPGTKAFSKKEIYKLFSAFSEINVKTVLTHGDLLESNVGQRHRGVILYIARRIWPKWFIKKFLNSFGLYSLIKAIK